MPNLVAGTAFVLHGDIPDNQGGIALEWAEQVVIPADRWAPTARIVLPGDPDYGSPPGSDTSGVVVRLEGTDTGAVAGRRALHWGSQADLGQDLVLSELPATDTETAEMSRYAMVPLTASRVHLLAEDDAGNTTHVYRDLYVPGYPRVSGAVASQTGAGAQVMFALSAPANVTVTVRNVAGRPVRSLVTDHPSTKGRNSVLWNGCSDTGLRVPAGTYLVEIQAKAADGTAARALTTLSLKR